MLKVRKCIKSEIETKFSCKIEKTGTKTVLFTSTYYICCTIDYVAKIFKNEF